MKTPPSGKAELAGLSLAIALAGCAPGGTASPGAQPAQPAAFLRSSPNAVALVPLYSYPANSGVWQPLVAAHAQTPGIPIEAIVDVTNLGPGKKIDKQYLAGVAQLHAGGIAVLGYVDTAYGKRALKAVETDIGHWHQWYGVDGIFLDVMAAKTGHEAYYSAATAYAKSLNLAPVIGNPGTDTAPSYAATVDALIVWETAKYPTLGYLSGGWHGQYDRSHFGFIAYAQPTLNVQFDDAAEQYVLYEFVTDGRGNGRYAHLPAYFADFLATL